MAQAAVSSEARVGADQGVGAGIGLGARGLAINGGEPVTRTAVPFMALGLAEADIAAANEVLRSGMLRQAKKCAELEERFGRMSDAKHALTCANGTCALQIAYGALFKPGDEILVPAWTYFATASMIAAGGLVPVFCDVREDTFQLDTADAARRITPRTRGIACTHLYGMPADIDAVQTLAAKHKLRVVYDAAQAHLARYDGKGIGAFGDAVTYSFYATKNLGTGEGGMVMTNSPDVARTMGLLRSHGETDKYLHEMIGFNYRMNDITAAIGCSKLDRLEAETGARQALAEKYDAVLAQIPGLRAPTRTPKGECIWHLYTVKMDPARFTCSRDEFTRALQAEGVPTAVHYPRALTRQPAFAPWVKDHPPVSDSLSARVFSLPMHHLIDGPRFDVVASALRKVAGAFAR